MSVYDSNDQVGLAIRVILPIAYIIISIISVIGNLIVLQIICANRFRHKSYHLLVASIVVADLLFTIIFMVIRAVSYAYLTSDWFVNVENWCKAEMYLLRLFDFVLAYTIMFLCFERVVSPSTCFFGIRKLRSGITITIGIWISSAYILIPILLFQQDIVSQKFGGYFCKNTEESVKLYWLSANPRRILDFLDFIFRILIPIFFMIINLIAICCRNDLKIYILRNKKDGEKNKSKNFLKKPVSTSLISSTSIIDTEQEILNNLYPRKLNYMVISYALVFFICQLPYEIYRVVMLWNHNIEIDLSENSINYAIEIPLLILKLINRTINPFLFICLADDDLFRKNCCRLWCLPCLPGCIGCQNCWCQDCFESICYECNYCLGNNSRDDTTLLQIYLDEDHSINTNRKNHETHIPIYKNDDNDDDDDYDEKINKAISSNNSRNENIINNRGKF